MKSSNPDRNAPDPALFDSNRYLLDGLLVRLGAEVTDLGILADQPEHLGAALDGGGASHDLVLTSGGVSTGEADHVRDVVEAIGRLVFWRVGIKPGRPVAMGIIPAGPNGNAAFVGLPGNPAAVFVTFVRVVRPLLLRLAGRAAGTACRPAGACGVCLQQAQGPSRIRAGHACGAGRMAAWKP